MVRYVTQEEFFRECMAPKWHENEKGHLSTRCRKSRRSLVKFAAGLCDKAPPPGQTDQAATGSNAQLRAPLAVLRREQEDGEGRPGPQARPRAPSERREEKAGRPEPRLHWTVAVRGLKL